MKILFAAFLSIWTISATGQQTEKIEVPNGVVYKYCDSATYERAKTIVLQELSGAPAYTLTKGVCFIGPVLWSRYGKVASLKGIQGGNLTILGPKKETLTGKMTQSKKDFKLVWDNLRSEIQDNNFKLRKATAQELSYFWSVISFDIEEPLIIIETPEHNYILNLSPKDYTLVWLDEGPRS